MRAPSPPSGSRSLALTHFLLIPAWLWRDALLPASVRRACRWFGAGFQPVRPAAILPADNGDRLEACRPNRQGCLRHGLSAAHGFAWLLIAALLFESLNAWLFGQTGSAEHGVYFASDEAVFAVINTITWGEIALLLPALAWWLWRYLRSA